MAERSSAEVRAVAVALELAAQWLKRTGVTFGCGSKAMGSHFGMGEFTAHVRTYFSGWIGMFTEGTIWVLTHGRLNPKLPVSNQRQLLLPSRSWGRKPVSCHPSVDGQNPVRSQLVGGLSHFSSIVHTASSMPAGPEFCHRSR